VSLMGIKFYCPQGHKLHVKAFLGGKRGICPTCGAKVRIPQEEHNSAHQKPDEVETDNVTMAAFADYAAANALEPDETSLKSLPPLAHKTATATTPASTQDGLESTDAKAIKLNVSISETTEKENAATDAPPDSLDEAPNAVWYVRSGAGGQFGPATGDVMRNWLSEGRIGADSVVWREGWENWKPASDVFPSWIHGSASVPSVPAGASSPADELAVAPLPFSSIASAIVREATHVEVDPVIVSNSSFSEKPAGTDVGQYHARRKRKSNLSLLIVIMLGLGILGLIPVLLYIVSNN